MKISHISSLVFFYLMLVSVRSNVIQDSCSQAAKSSPNIKLDFCVSAFKGNPKAESATSVADLVPVLIEKGKADAKSIVSTISKLLGDKSLEEHAKSCLEDCSNFYSDAESQLQEGEEAFGKKDCSTANIVISPALDASSNCEESFKEKGIVSPLTKENDGFLQLTAISLAFVNMANKVLSVNLDL